MTERPIIFSAPMVRAILQGRKTQTRRIVRDSASFTHVAKDVIGTQPNALWWFDEGDPTAAKWRQCPYGMPGDRLWMRETFAHIDDHKSHGPGCVVYRADPPHPTDCVDRWRPSIYMPRWASRAVLEVTDVRVERVQDITEDDAKAEGARDFFDLHPCFSREQTLTSGERADDSPVRAGFACLWDEINGDRATWKRNPWVWAVSFRRL